MMQKEKGLEEKMKKLIVGNVNKFAGNFRAKNIQICIYTNLYFLVVEISRSCHNLRRWVR